MPLTNIAVQKAKPKSKPTKLFDGGGLFLLIQPGGGKWWRYKYRFAGKEKLLALGSYPDVSLAEARERHKGSQKGRWLQVMTPENNQKRTQTACHPKKWKHL